MNGSIAVEKHWSIKEIAEQWGLSLKTVRTIFAARPGVLRLASRAKRGVREYVSLRVPQSVLDGVHRELRG
jgi:hypothetical protein